jgi:hypothetical protein
MIQALHPQDKAQRDADDPHRPGDQGPDPGAVHRLIHAKLAESNQFSVISHETENRTLRTENFSFAVSK